MKNITYRPKEKRYIGRKQINGQIILVYAKTQKECYSKLNNLIKITKNKLTIEKISSFTVEEYWDKWYKENKEPFIATTTKEDFMIIKRKLSPIFQIKISQLTKEKILFFLNTLQENRTKQKVILQLKSMLDTAVKEHKIKFNPFDTIIIKNTKLKPKPPFNYEEQTKIINNINGKDFEPIILLYLTTGLRLKEMPFNDIEKHLNDNNILTTINLKGRERGKIRTKQIKLSNNMAEIVRKNINTFHKYKFNTISKSFKKFLNELNIKGSIVNCRHTFATNCFYLGKNELIIAKEMGHSTSQITKDNYINIDYNLTKEKLLKLYNNLYNLS